MWPSVRDRVAWFVGLSVCHTSKPCRNGWTDRDAVWFEDLGWPNQHCVRWGSRSPYGKGQFSGERSCRPTCHPSRRQMSSSAACAPLWWHYRQRRMTEFVVTRCAMRPFVKLLWPLALYNVPLTYGKITYAYRTYVGLKITHVQARSTVELWCTSQSCYWSNHADNYDNKSSQRHDNLQNYYRDI